MSNIRSEIYEALNLSEDSSINETLSESSFKDPIRFKISIVKNDDVDRWPTPQEKFNYLVKNISIKPEFLVDNSDGSGEICFPGREDILDLINEFFNEINKGDFSIDIL